MSADDVSLPTSDHRAISSMLALIAVVAAAGWWLSPIFDSGFLTDDFQALHKVAKAVDPENAGDHPVRGLLGFYGRSADDRFQLYRPSVLVSYGVTLLSFGVDPRPFQITNWCAHLLSGVLVFFLLRTTLPRLGVVGSSMATLWFLISPLQLEVVAWSAARSEWLSFLFGTGAVVFALRRPRRWLVPAILVSLSLTAKETALVYPLALILLGWIRPIEGRSDDRDVRRALRSALGWSALIGGYFLLRWSIFGSLFSVDYNNRSVASYFEFDTVWRIGRSIWRLFAALSEDVFSTSLGYWPTAIVAAFATALGLHDGLRVLASNKGLIGLVVLLFGLQLAMALPFNEVTPKLVNTRALYGGMAMVALVFAAGTTSPHGIIRRYLPLVILLVIGLIASRSGLRLYVEAARRIDAPLATVRAGMEAVDDGRVGTIALLGYPFPEPAYFAGGFTMAGAIRPALSRPFLGRDHWIEKVASDTAPSGDYRGFEELLRGDTSVIAMFMFRADVAGGPIIARRVSLGRFSADGRVTLRPIAPESMAVHTLDAADPASLAPSFEVALKGDAHRFVFRFVKSNHLVAEVPFSTADAAIRLTEIGEKCLRFTPPAMPAAALTSLDPRQIIGWSIQAYDESGTLLGESEVRGLIVEKR